MKLRLMDTLILFLDVYKRQECTTDTMEALIENTERSDMVATNIGKVPIEDRCV